MQLVTLSLDQLVPPIVILREDMDAEKLAELVADIKANGVEEPICVTPHEGKFRVVFGWRRALAAREAGLLEIPCVVKDLDEGGEVETMLRENLHREDPHPLDEGKMFMVMHEALHLTVEGIAMRTGKSTAYVRARMEIMAGPEDVRESLRQGSITLSAAREILRADDPRDRQYVLYHAALGGATTDLVRRWVQERNLARAAGNAAPPPEGAPVIEGGPVALSGRCDWHGGQVPLDSILSFHVCAECYPPLIHLRDELQKEAPPEGGGNRHEPVS